jgi:anti-sigma factor RsiW
MMTSLIENDELQLNAYCDGELDSVAASEFERRITNNVSLKTEYDRLMLLLQAVRSLPDFEVPSNLQARIQSQLRTERRSNIAGLRRRSWSLQGLAAAAFFGAVTSASVTMTIERFGEDKDVASQVVSSHMRGLLAPRAFDIASSDRHTVKPWFTARLPASPQVPDLSAHGFALLGGRVDVIDYDPVPTIVYGQGAHTISLTTLRSEGPLPEQAVAGYNVRSWREANFTYVAVSDLPGADLAAFERAFSTAAPAAELGTNKF